ncbi:R-spondin-1 [Hyla sarda]|uniref:R-spondin-1 n=1 Tax=Hyla sarda TaxID=327740 RepID=UPI0024C39761|nr:R-spondin-1 [Hyla sarda]XP_056416572.1 R-spondin-1 [Hyla sarda]
MQFGLFTVLVLILMDIADSSRVVKGRRHRRRSTDVSQSCTKGCEACSEFNGCVKCLPKLFILLERNDIRQIGVCLQSCPKGYYGDRNRDISKCMRCKMTNCEECFSKTFCTKCNDGFYLHKGVCYSTCPEGFIAANGTKECSSTQCEMSEWGSWSPCTPKGKKCGRKNGFEERSRKVLKAPLGGESLCPPTTEKRKCAMTANTCPKGEGKNRKNQGKGNKNKNRNVGTGNKKKRNQQRVTSMPITPSVPTK